MERENRKKWYDRVAIFYLDVFAQSYEVPEGAAAAADEDVMEAAGLLMDMLTCDGSASEGPEEADKEALIV